MNFNVKGYKVWKVETFFNLREVSPKGGGKTLLCESGVYNCLDLIKKTNINKQSCSIFFFTRNETNRSKRSDKRHRLKNKLIRRHYKCY